MGLVTKEEFLYKVDVNGDVWFHLMQLSVHSDKVRGTYVSMEVPVSVLTHWVWDEDVYL